MRAARPLPLINMRLILCRIEEARLRGNVGRPRLALNRLWRRSAIDSDIHAAVAEPQGEQLRRARVRGMGKSRSVAAGHPDVALSEGPLRMGELGHFPRCRQSFAEARDALIEKIAPKPARDEVQVSARVA